MKRTIKKAQPRTVVAVERERERERERESYTLINKKDTKKLSKKLVLLSVLLNRFIKIYKLKEIGILYLYENT